MIYTVLIWLAGAVALALSWKVPQARLFVALIVAGFTLPKFLHVGGLSPLHLFMTNILIDSVIILLIDRFRREEWPRRLCLVYLVSIHVSLAAMTVYCVLRFAEGTGAFLLASSPPPSTLMGYLLEAYVIVMEGLTYCALAIIGRIGWPEVVNGWRDLHSDRMADRTPARSALRAPRSSPSWQHRP